MPDTDPMMRNNEAPPPPLMQTDQQREEEVVDKLLGELNDELDKVPQIPTRPRYADAAAILKKMVGIVNATIDELETLGGLP